MRRRLAVAARVIAASISISFGPPIMIRCSTLSRRTSTSWRCRSRSKTSTTASRGWRLSRSGKLNRRPSKTPRSTSDEHDDDKCATTTSATSFRKRHAGRAPLQNCKTNKINCNTPNVPLSRKVNEWLISGRRDSYRYATRFNQHRQRAAGDHHVAAHVGCCLPRL